MFSRLIRIITDLDLLPLTSGPPHPDLTPALSIYHINIDFPLTNFSDVVRSLQTSINTGECTSVERSTTVSSTIVYSQILSHM